MECFFEFAECDDLSTFTNLFSWDFPNQNEENHPVFEVNSVNITLPYQYFFIRISELTQLLNIYIVENLPEDDVHQFIVLNGLKFQLIAQNGQEIQKNTLLRNMVELDEALKNKSEFHFIKKIDN